ncbi:penicillin-binding protein 1C [Variovorax sp. HJSM1_2]|uniref:penicillin-binding protein 1C n=1 Tax=Variovorax sp. HJSM1_2 TaxID=3366263 RepID=UPI003BBF3145
MTSTARRRLGIRCHAAALALLLYTGHAAGAMPSFDEVRQDFRSSDTLLLSREGDVLQRQRTDSGVRRGSWVQLADVSPALRTALVLSEDQRFYAHSGIDWRAVSAAAWANVWNTKTRGASTLTMQLAGLLDADWRVGPGGRTVVQKIGQALAAQNLERHWRKDQILEAYLNLVPLRGDLVGVDALARSLFNTAPSGLGTREAAVTVALIRSPNAAPQRVAERACGVLKQLEAGLGTVDCAALSLFVTASLQQRTLAASEGVAPHAARQALQQATPPLAGQSIRSTLRAGLQRFAVNTLQQQLRELRQRHVEDGAIVVLDNATGDVLAWVGSSGALSAAAEVDGVLARRQPGSTLKPFLYGQAIAERRLTAASLLEDAPTHIATAGGLYIPQNYDHQFRGWTSVRTALAASLNVPAVRTLVMVSPESFHQQLAAVGLPLQESGDFYGYSLALGSAEVSLLNLSNSYRTLANLGQAGPTRLLLDTTNAGMRPARTSPPRSTASPPALDARAAFIVGDMLSDPIARAPTFGTDSVLATRFWTAVKTGTSKDMRDNWALGWSQRYTVGVWVGNASGAPMWDVSGTSGAAPIWATVMAYLHRREPSRAPAAPPGLVQQEVQFGQQLEAARSEWFLQGTEQTVFAIESGASTATTESAAAMNGLNTEGALLPAKARITAPTNGTILALDPDIPPKRQRLRLTASSPGLYWRVDGKPLARGAETMWFPWPGRHKLQLVDARGVLQDEVQIEVRGAGLKAATAQGLAGKSR